MITTLITVYSIVTGVILFVGLIGLAVSFDTSQDLRKPVRVLLLAFVWPIILPFALCRLIMWAFDLKWDRFSP